MRKKSPRQKELDKTYAVIRNYYRKKYGNTCQICGKYRTDLGLFHIFPRGKYPNIQLLEENLLWVGWFCCHQPWHHDFYAAQEIEKKIIDLRGLDYRDRLKVRDKVASKLSLFEIKMVREAYRQIGEE